MERHLWAALIVTEYIFHRLNLYILFHRRFYWSDI